MKLTVNNNLIYMPSDAKISIEKNSPVLNDDTGTFSYPFPVPTAPNQKTLGWPGRLQRVGNIPDRSFVLEDCGLQVLKGEVDYTDGVTRDEVGLVLKSGMTEFYKKAEGAKLSDLDFGSEFLWNPTVSRSEINTRMLLWHGYNEADNSPIVMPPMVMDGPDYPTVYNTKYINKHDAATGKIKMSYYEFGAYVGLTGYFLFQFRIWWVLKQIFEFYGYTIEQNDLETTEYKKAVLFSKPFYANGRGESDTAITMYLSGQFEYATVMPDVDVIEFIDVAKKIPCIIIDIDERKKTVRISQAKKIFTSENLDTRTITELAGWQHEEVDSYDGFALRYMAQDDELDIREDYVVTNTVTSTLPTPTEEMETAASVYRVSETGRDFIVGKDESGNYIWKRIGRLKGMVVDGGEDETVLNAKIPVQVAFSNIEGPYLTCIPLPNLLDGRIIQQNEIIISLYHGLRYFNGVYVPYTCAESYSLSKWTTPLNQQEFHNTSPSLVPAKLYDDVYADWLNWHYQARAWKKYFRMSLQEVINLQWNKRYIVNGIPIIFDKISFDLPYNDIIEAEGYTA